MIRITFTLLLVANTITGFCQCKVPSDVKKCRLLLEDYKFSGAAETPIAFDEQTKTIDLEFTAYASEKYRLIFCSTFQSDEVVKILVYDGRKGAANRKLVFDNSSGTNDVFWIFEPPRTGNYYIEYEVPPAKNGIAKDACISLIIGYKQAN